MAVIQTIERKKGTGYRVVYRNKDTGKMSSRIFDDKEKAQTFKDFLEANGASLKAAIEVKRRYDKKVPTVYETVTRHIDQLTKVQSGTIKKYRSRAKHHIDGTTLGNMAIDKVTKQHVIEWLDGLTAAKGANVAAGTKLSPRTRAEVQAILSAAFTTAVDEGRMVKNVAKGVGEAATIAKREPVFLSQDDLETLENAVGKNYRLFIRVLGKTGLRYSEATALRKRDVQVDGKRATLRVTRAWKTTDAGLEIGPPKTRKARRNVSCSLDLSAELIDHMEALAPDDLVFTRPGGLPLHNAWFHKEVWQTAVNSLVESGALADKPWIHEIRKAHTTHLLQAGVPVNVVQARLGHEDPNTTLRIYAQLSNDDDQNAADALG